MCIYIATDELYNMPITMLIFLQFIPATVPRW